MNESNLNITVSVKDQAQLESLFNKIQDGSSTISEQKEFVKLATKAWQGMNSEVRTANATFGNSVVAAKDLISNGMNPLLGANGKLMNSYFTLGEQNRRFNQIMQMGGVAATESAGQSTNRLIDVMKADRQERRLGMFAVMESMHAIDGLVGKQTVMSSAISNGAQAVFGMKFALEAMGLAATAAWPVAIIVGAWSIISSILSSEKKADQEIVDELQKQYDLKVKLGIISKQQALSDAQNAVNEAQYDLTTLQNKQKIIAANMAEARSMGNPELYSHYAMQLPGASNDVTKQMTVLLESEEKFKNLYDAEQKTNEKSSKSQEKLLSDLQSEQDARYQLGQYSNAEYVLLLKKREQQAIITHDVRTQAALHQQILAVQQKMAEGQYQGLNLGSSLSGGKFNLANPLDAGMIDKNQFGKLKSTEDYNKDSKQKEMQATNQYLIDPLKAGFQSTTWSAMQGIDRMWEQCSGFAKTVLGQALEEIANTLMQKLAVTGIDAVIGWISGGLSIGASSGGAAIGSSLIAGAGGGSIATNSPKIYNTMQVMNNAGRSSGGGSSQVVSGELIMKGGNLVLAYKIASQQRANRVM